MDEERKKLGGLIEIAEEQQAAVATAVAVAQAAGERLERAARQWEEAGAKVVRACSAAIGEAVTAEAQTLAARLEAPFVAPVHRLQEAAAALHYTTRTLDWWVIAGVLVLGIVLGGTVSWFLMQSRLDTLLNYAKQTNEQTTPKMPAAPANVAPKKGGK